MNNQARQECQCSFVFAGVGVIFVASLKKGAKIRSHRQPSECQRSVNEPCYSHIAQVFLKKTAPCSPAPFSAGAKPSLLATKPISADSLAKPSLAYASTRHKVLRKCCRVREGQRVLFNYNRARRKIKGTRGRSLIYAERNCMAGTRFFVIDAMASKFSVSTVSVCLW